MALKLTDAATASSASGPRRRAGVTLVELMIFLVVSTAVIGSILPLVTAQMRAFSSQRDMLDASETLRSSAAVLSWELRQISASGGDLITADSSSFVIRATSGFAVVCADHATLPRLGLVVMDGSVSVGDSALGYASGDAGPADDEWLPLTVQNTLTPGAGGIASCDWASETPDLVAHVDGDTVRIESGAPFRSFAVKEYGIFSSGGRSWIGRRTPGDTTWETIGGPVRSQANGGLEFAYFDESGAATTDPTAVRTVQVTIRSESSKKSTAIGSGELTARGDSLRTRVLLRG